MDEKKMIEILTMKLTPKRLMHSFGVSQTAEILAGKFGVNGLKARLAGLLHDCGRVIPTSSLLAVSEANNIFIDEVSRQEPILLHAPLGAYFAREEYGIHDQEILQAIEYHTVGAKQMTDLAKIIYISDMIEPSRSYPGVDIIRSMVEVDLDASLIWAYDQSIQFVIDRKGLLHPATIEGRNYLLLHSKR